MLVRPQRPPTPRCAKRELRAPILFHVKRCGTALPEHPRHCRGRHLTAKDRLAAWPGVRDGAEEELPSPMVCLLPTGEGNAELADSPLGPAMFHLLGQRFRIPDRVEGAGNSRSRLPVRPCRGRRLSRELRQRQRLRRSLALFHVKQPIPPRASRHLAFAAPRGEDRPRGFPVRLGSGHRAGPPALLFAALPPLASSAPRWKARGPGRSRRQ